jgi:hypothetical protein
MVVTADVQWLKVEGLPPAVLVLRSTTMYPGLAASLMLDLATSTIADRQRSARARSQRAVLRRTRRDAESR